MEGDCSISNVCDIPMVIVLLFVLHVEDLVPWHKFEFKVLLAVIGAVPLGDVPQCGQVERSIELKHKATAN